MSKILTLAILGLLTLPALAEDRPQSPSRGQQIGRHGDHKDHMKNLPPEVKEALKACKEEVGLKKEEGKRKKPSKEEMKKVRDCMESKGFKPPKHKRQHEE